MEVCWRHVWLLPWLPLAAVVVLNRGALYFFGRSFPCQVLPERTPGCLLNQTCFDIVPHGSTPVYLEPWRSKPVEYLSWGTLLEFSGELLQRRHKGGHSAQIIQALRSGTSWDSYLKSIVWSSLWYLLLVVCCLYPGHQVCTAIKVNQCHNPMYSITSGDRSDSQCIWYTFLFLCPS